VTRLVVVDATPLGPGPSGARRRLEALLPRLAARLSDDVFEVHWARDGGGPPAAAMPDNVVHALVPASCRGGLRRLLRRRRDLLARHRAAPFTHLLVDHGPVVAAPGLCTVVTLHDLRFLHGYGGTVRALYTRLGGYRRALARAAAVVAVAPSVAAEAAARLGVAPDRLHVAPNAVDADLFAPDAGTRRGSALLVVSRDEPRKARGAAVLAARQAGLDLVVVDGDADDAALARRYREAAWLLAPSLLEGYDLPVAEALASGTPVLASDIPAHRDLVALGARGLVLVEPPSRDGGSWRWDAAVRRLAEPAPVDVAPPAPTWDAAADVVVRALRGPPPQEAAAAPAP